MPHRDGVAAEGHDRRWHAVDLVLCAPFSLSSSDELPDEREMEYHAAILADVELSVEDKTLYVECLRKIASKPANRVQLGCLADEIDDMDDLALVRALEPVHSVSHGGAFRPVAPLRFRPLLLRPRRVTRPRRAIRRVSRARSRSPGRPDDGPSPRRSPRSFAGGAAV